MIDEKKLIEDLESTVKYRESVYGEDREDMFFHWKTVKNVITQQTKINSWIPCKDRLPEDEECNVLCDIYDEEENRHIIKIMLYKDLGNCEWEFLNSFGLPQNVVAWQPLPEEYDG